MLVKWITHTFFRQCQDQGASQNKVESQHRIKWNPNIQLLVLHCQLMETKVQSYSNITGIQEHRDLEQEHPDLETEKERESIGHNQTRRAA